MLQVHNKVGTRRAALVCVMLLLAVALTGGSASATDSGQASAVYFTWQSESESTNQSPVAYKDANGNLIGYYPTVSSTNNTPRKEKPNPHNRGGGRHPAPCDLRRHDLLY